MFEFFLSEQKSVPSSLDMQGSSVPNKNKLYTCDIVYTSDACVHLLTPSCLLPHSARPLYICMLLHVHGTKSIWIHSSLPKL